MSRSALCLALGVALGLQSCAVQAEPGWEGQLEQLVRPELLQGARGAVARLPADADPAPGDRVELVITLDQAARTRTWRLAVTVDEVAMERAVDMRVVPDFELRVDPSPARQREIERRAAEHRARAPRDDLDDSSHDWAHDAKVAGLTVEAFGADGTSLGRAESTEILRRLRTGLLPACRAGYRQREVMRGRVAAGRQAAALILDDQAYADVQLVGAGVAICESLFRILQANPVTRQILSEVLELPSLWSIVTNWGVRVSFRADFFAAERVDPARFPGESRELWSVPLVVLLNGQPGFLARVVVGPSGSPDGAVAGIYGVIARHPSDASRRVVVRRAEGRQ